MSCHEHLHLDWLFKAGKQRTLEGEAREVCQTLDARGQDMGSRQEPLPKEEGGGEDGKMAPWSLAYLPHRQD